MCQLRYGNNYPDVCPPPNAKKTCITLYRGVHSEGDTLLPDDFLPVFDKRPKPIYKNNEECNVKGLSFFTTKEKLSTKMRAFPNIGKRIIEVDINEDCGLLLIESNGHCNLWDYSDPDIITAIGENWREV